MNHAVGRFLFFLALFTLVMCPALFLAASPGVVSAPSASSRVESLTS